MGFDIYTLIFLALAVFIFFRLRAVLGQRTGNERPPIDPLRRGKPPARDGGRESGRETGRETGKVIPLPAPRGSEPVMTSLAEPNSGDLKPAGPRWAGLAEEGSPLASGLDAIAATDKAFDAAAFVTGARRAYEMIVTAFNTGDVKQLRTLLSREVLDAWTQVIQEREARGERVEANFVAIDKADLASASVRGRTAQIAVRFVSQIISVTRDREGAVVDGSAEDIKSVTDLWTFARDAGSGDPNWRLVATDEA